MNTNRIRITLDTIGCVNISGLTREEFDRLTGDLKLSHYAQQGEFAENWNKHFVACDGKGAYLDLSFQTNEPPVTPESPDGNDGGEADDWQDLKHNPYLLSGAELERLQKHRG